MKGLEHIGIAVRSLSDSAELFDLLLGKPAYKEEIVAGEAVKTLFYDCGNTKIELLESSDDSSAIHKFIEKRG